MKIIIFGNGQVGQSLHSYFKDKYEIEVITDRVDDLLKHKLAEIVAKNRNEIFINTIAVSNTRYCENNWVESYKVNVEFPIKLALNLKFDSCKSKYIFISSGCIFDGNKIPKKEDDPPTPLIAYSRQKLMAETIRHIYENHVIIRPRMIFSTLPLPSNLLYKINGFHEFIDEQNSMTSCEDICNFCDIIIKKDLRGTFNLCDNGTISPFAIKREISNIWGWKNPVLPIKKEQLHEKVGLSLTDTLIDSSKAAQYVELGNVRDKMIETIKKCEWLKK